MLGNDSLCSFVLFCCLSFILGTLLCILFAFSYLWPVLCISQFPPLTSMSVCTRNTNEDDQHYIKNTINYCKELLMDNSWYSSPYFLSHLLHFVIIWDIVSSLPLWIYSLSIPHDSHLVWYVWSYFSVALWCLFDVSCWSFLFVMLLFLKMRKFPSLPNYVNMTWNVFKSMYDDVFCSLCVLFFVFVWVVCVFFVFFCVKYIFRELCRVFCQKQFFCRIWCGKKFGSIYCEGRKERKQVYKHVVMCLYVCSRHYSFSWCIQIISPSGSCLDGDFDFCLFH